MSKYTNEQVSFLKSIANGRSRKEIIRLYNERFKDNPITISILKGIMTRNNINTGLDGRFKKGCQSFNKGLKQTDYMSPDAIERSKLTRFQKGNIPKNHKAVGSTRINVDGYCEIKVSEPNKWKLRSRYNWEQVCGKIPRGQVILHRDQDKLNDDISNLIMIPQCILSRINHIGLCEDVEINDTIVNISKLQMAIIEKQK